MSDRHVTPTPDGWAVEKPNAQRPSAKTPTQAEAVQRAVEIVANDGGGEVVVHGSDGAFRVSRTVPGGAPDTDRIAAALAASATATGARATATAAAGEVSDAAGEVADDASVTAKKVVGETRTGAARAAATADAGAAGIGAEIDAYARGEKDLDAAAEDAAAIARTTGAQVRDQADRTARQVAGEARAAGRRAAARAEDTARRAGAGLAAGADRAATLGEGLGEEAETAADRVGRRVHTITEAAAAPLDGLARALNPVRLTGRAVGLVAAGGLSLLGRGAARGSDAARRGVHRAAGQ
jgi:hypothetical protein